MEEKANILESLLEKAEEYGKTSFELFKLKALNETLGVVSSIISRTVTVVFIFTFFLMGTIGVAFLLGEILGKLWYGFFIVAAFYGIIGAVLYFFMNNRLKKLVEDFLIKQVYK
ncbi:MAG: phage holin family protein [Rikenellaceae bacterium]